MTLAESLVTVSLDFISKDFVDNSSGNKSFFF